MSDCVFVEISPGTFRCSVCKFKIKPVSGNGDVRRRCPKAIDTPLRLPLECVHRGELTGETHDCELCGGRNGKVAVYACEVRGECVLTRWTISNRKMIAAGETCCVSCADRTRQDGSKPMAEVLVASPQESAHP